MNKIIPYLWYDKEAKEAADLYTSVFKNSRIVSHSTMENTPSGTVDMLSIELEGQEFGMMSAGPYFKFNPSISFLVACKSKEEVDEIWEKLSPGGQVLMELGSYPFSEHYGWTTDRFGVSWQIMAMGDLPIKQKITPTLMFVGEVCGKAEEAIHFYTSVFHDSKVGDMMRYGPDQEPDKAGTLAFASFTLEGQDFAAMDSAQAHDFQFNEAISLLIYCENQEEIDYYWNKLSAYPEAEQCGWVKDKYRVSWQVVPRGMEEFFRNATDEESLDRVTQAMLKMKKLDIAKLEEAAKG